MDFTTFFHANWMLFAALVVVFFLIIGNEIKTFKLSKFLISIPKALQLNNDDKAIFVDIRSHDEYKARHLPNAIHIEEKQLVSKLTESDRFKDKMVILYCDMGTRSGTACANIAKVAKEAHLELHSLQGGINAWEQAGLPIKSSKK